MPATAHLPRDRHGLQVLEYAAMWDLLASRTVGRLGIVVAGEPVIFPVNYQVLGQSLMFRTGDGSKYDAAVRGASAVFQLDEYDHDTRTGWPVVLNGWLRVMVHSQTTGSSHPPPGPVRRSVRIIWCGWSRPACPDVRSADPHPTGCRDARRGRLQVRNVRPVTGVSMRPRLHLPLALFLLVASACATSPPAATPDEPADADGAVGEGGSSPLAAGEVATDRPVGDEPAVEAQPDPTLTVLPGESAPVGIDGTGTVHLPLRPVELLLRVNEPAGVHWPERDDPTANPTWSNLWFGDDAGWVAVFTLSYVAGANDERWSTSEVPADLQRWIADPRNHGGFELDGPNERAHPSGEDAFEVTLSSRAGSVFERAGEVPVMFQSTTSDDGFYGYMQPVGDPPVTYRAVRLDGTWVVVTSQSEPGRAIADDVFELLAVPDER
jgi:hypothetical protein